MELTKSEREIMDVFWESEDPLSRADLLKKSVNKSWKDSSVHILLNGMLQKGVIREAGMVKCSKTYGRTFQPTMTREEYYAKLPFSYSLKPDIVGLMTALWNRKDISKEQREEISKVIGK